MIITRISLEELNYRELVCIMFAYHMREDPLYDDMGTLDVVLVKEATFQPVSVWVADGPQGAKWLTASIDTEVTETDKVQVGHITSLRYLHNDSHRYFYSLK